MLILFLLLPIAVLLGVGFYLFIVACKRRPDRPWLDEEAMRKTHYNQYYDNIRFGHQWLQENARDVWTQSHDGLKLHAYWIPAEKPIGTIVLMHGYRSSMLVDFSLIVPYYHSIGLNLLIPHQRSHGPSEGKYITFGVKESRDVHSWLQYHDRVLYQGKVVISGLSMGASTVLFTASDRLPENVKGIIGDCGFTSPWEIISRVYKQTTKLSAGPVLWAAELWARLFAGFSLKEKDTRITLANTKLPILLIHGKADDFVPCYMSQQAYDKCVSKKHMHLVDGAGHGTSFLYDSTGVKEALRSFIADVLEVEIAK